LVYIKSRSLHANLIITILSDVADPRKSLVAALLDNLEVAHLHARNCEVRDLELDLDWDSTVLLSLFDFNRWEPK
jgi:hypothetical protein